MPLTFLERKEAELENAPKGKIKKGKRLESEASQTVDNSLHECAMYVFIL